MKNDSFPRIYDVSTTAEAIGIKPRVLRHWVEKKEVIPLRIAGRIYFTPGLIKKMIENKIEEIENEELDDLEE